LREGQEQASALVAKLTGNAPIVAGNGKIGPVATDIDCDECGKPMVIRDGRRGKFLACSGYPKCKNTSDVPAKLLEEMAGNGNGQATPATPATGKKGASKKKAATVELVEEGEE
jgi:ssDNA-binding Zn-finger/Zn-ribbon topoisomerase 1